MLPSIKRDYGSFQVLLKVEKVIEQLEGGCPTKKLWIIWAAKTLRYVTTTQIGTIRSSLNCKKVTYEFSAHNALMYQPIYILVEQSYIKYNNANIRL